jgi:hypothetical protein
MAPQGISRGIVEQIERIWGEDPARSALAIRRRYNELTGHRNLVGKRKVQQIVAEVKKRTEGRKAFDRVEWKPWENDIGTPEDTNYLLQVDAWFLMNLGRHLCVHEAKWARRLRAILADLDPRMQIMFIVEYGVREAVAINLQIHPAPTGDLDGLLAFKPWLPDNRGPYENCLTHNHIPPPLMYNAPGIAEFLLSSSEAAERRAKWRLEDENLEPWQKWASAELTADPWESALTWLGLEVDPPVSPRKILSQYPFLIWMLYQVVILPLSQFASEDNS